MFDYPQLLTMFFSFTIEIVVAGILLLRKKTNFRFKWYISVPIGILMVVISALLPVFGLKYLPVEWNIPMNILAYTVPFLCIYGAFLFTYKVSPLSLILTMSIAYTFQSMAYQATSLVLDTGLQGALLNSMGQDMYNTYYPIISRVLEHSTIIIAYIVFYFVIARTYVKYSKYILKTTSIIILSVIMYFATNVANAYVVRISWVGWAFQFVGMSVETVNAVLRTFIIVFCMLFNYLIVGSFKVVENAQENMIIKATLGSKIRQKEMTEQNISFINMKCHDLRKELRRLKGKKDCLTDEDFALLEESLNFYDSSISTGNIDVDALIQDKLIYCNSVGIEFTALVDGEAFSEIAPSDVYFLLTNIIDNAIEAVEQTDAKEHKVIALTASKRQGVLFIEQSNYFKGQLSFNPDGSIRTTKSDKRYHGYGTKSIAYIAKKYDGEMDIEVKDNIFKLKIAI